MMASPHTPCGADGCNALARRSALARRGCFFALLTALLIGLSAPAAAQSRGDGTIYSRFGLGELETATSPRAQALGGQGTALRSLNYTNFANPASWSDQVFTRAAAGVFYRGIEATDGAGGESQLSAGSLGFVQFSFPLYANTLGVGLAFRPYSRSNYRVVTPGQIADPVNPDTTIGYEVNYEGRGGLQQVTGGLGWRVSDALSVGASADVVFGIIEEARRTAFENTLLYRTTDRTDATRLVGVSGTVGALLTLPDVLRSDDALSIGATFTLPATLSGERTRTLGQTLNRDTLSVEDGSAEIPYGASLGLAYQPDERWTFVADGLYEPWSNFESDFTLPGGQALSNRGRASFGVEVVPAGNNVTESYLSRMGYRLGGSYEHSYVQAPTNLDSRSIRELAATAGFSFPTLLPGTRVDVNVEVGTRGTAGDGLVRDLFYGLSLNVNVGERWFQDRKLR